MSKARVSLVCLVLVAACGPTSPSMSTEGSGGSSTGPSTETNAEPTTTGSSDEPVAPIAWTYTRDGVANGRDMALGVAVDKAGRIIVVGQETVESKDGLILALSPEGKELWRRTFDGAGREDLFLDVVLDDDGKIFVAGSEEVAADVRTSIVRAFDAEGGELWRFAEEPRPGHADTTDLALAEGVLYSIGTDGLVDGGGLFTVRRHDPGTGGLAWRTATQAGWREASGTGITATAERVVGVGYVRDEDEDIQPLTVVLDVDGAILSETIQEIPRGYWNDIVPIGAAGDLMLVGGTFMPGVINRDVIVRRVDANFVQQWSHIHDHEMLEDMGLSIAASGNGAVFIAGAVTATGTAGEHTDILGARYTADGTLLWTDLHDHPAAHGADFGMAAAAAPGFLVLAGYETTPDHDADIWVRRFNDD